MYETIGRNSRDDLLLAVARLRHGVVHAFRHHEVLAESRPESTGHLPHGLPQYRGQQFEVICARPTCGRLQELFGLERKPSDRRDHQVNDVLGNDRRSAGRIPFPPIVTHVENERAFTVQKREKAFHEQSIAFGLGENDVSKGTRALRRAPQSSPHNSVTARTSSGASWMSRPVPLWISSDNFTRRWLPLASSLRNVPKIRR